MAAKQLRLTAAETRAALAAISQQTYGNARDFQSWKQGTSGTLAEWRALLRVEEKLKALL